MSEILVISVHPDDEVLGCGGTLLKHKDNGDSINLLIVTAMSEEQGYSRDSIIKRETEIKQIEKFFGFKKVMNLNIPTMSVDAIPIKDLVSKFLEHIKEIKPEILFIPYLYDAHSDHRVVYDSLSPFFKSFRFPFIKKVLMMETVSETEYAFPVDSRMFSPNYYVDISNYIGKKIEAMKIYESEIKEAPFPRSEKVIQALSTFRGSFIACDYAEAFMIVKEVW